MEEPSPVIKYPLIETPIIQPTSVDISIIELYEKIKNILFRIYYEIGPDYKTFLCIYCNTNHINRENFEIKRLGHTSMDGPDNIKNIIPVCEACSTNQRDRLKKRLVKHMYSRFIGRINYSKKNNLVNDDEIQFVQKTLIFHHSNYSN